MDIREEPFIDFRGDKISINNVLATQAELLRSFYVGYFLHCEDGTYEGFLTICRESVCSTVKIIDDIYADQVEGMKWKLIKKEERNA